jgi:hypothetical protein
MEQIFTVNPQTVMEALSELSLKYSQIAININDFVHILYAGKEEGYDRFVPVTSRDVLVSGHYGTFNNMKIMVRKNVKQGYMLVEE